MAYVYRHIRLDKNIPFYIGIGGDDIYKRANDRKFRNPHWLRIVKKTEYEIEILFDNISWPEACKKEIEFIALYGRSKDGGVLTNITKGGDGKLGIAPANAFAKGHIPWAKGRKLSQERIETLRLINTGRPAWNKGISPAQSSIEKGNKTKAEKGIQKGVNHPMYGTKMPDYVKEALRKANKEREPWNKGKRMSVIQMHTNGIVIKTFKSINQASEETGVMKGNISHCCKGTRNTAGGFLWKINGTP